MKRLLWGVGLIAPLGGLLFGYNTAIISSALIFLKNDFTLSTFAQEMVVSIVLIGALLGAMSAGSLSDRFGRKPTIILSDIFFIIGGVTLIITTDIFGVFFGRFIGGIGVGIGSLTVPLYIAEMSPPKQRGALVTLNQLAITVGILLAFLIGLMESDAQNWRAMFGFVLVPAILQLCGMFFLPESPTHLAMNAQVAKAKKLISKIRGPKAVDSVIAKLKKPDRSKSHVSSLFHKALLPALFIGLGLSILQQVTGINTVIYYANQIFELAGFRETTSALWASISVGIVNVIATIVSVFLLDRVGRRPLLLTGMAGMTLGLLALTCTFLFDFPAESLLSVLSLMLYVAAFAIGIGPVAWLIISEIYPHRIRGRAMSLAIMANWIANYIVSLTFLTLIEVATSAGAFFVYALICAFAFWFIHRFVPETKGKTLEQIEGYWRK